MRSLVDWFRGRSIQDAEGVPEAKEDVPETKESFPENTVAEKLEALRILSRDLQVPRQRKSNGTFALEGDVCWAFQVKLKRLRHTEDAAEMIEILSFMRRLVSDKVLKRFTSSCSGLPGMINSVCCCCFGLDDNRANIDGLTQNIDMQIHTTAVEVVRSLLLPIAKRGKSQEFLHDDTRRALVASLNLFHSTIARCSRDWPEHLADQVKRIVDIIPPMVRKSNLANSDVETALKSLSDQIPAALGVLAQVPPRRVDTYPSVTLRYTATGPAWAIM